MSFTSHLVSKLTYTSLYVLVLLLFSAGKLGAQSVLEDLNLSKSKKQYVVFSTNHPVKNKRSEYAFHLDRNALFIKSLRQYGLDRYPGGIKDPFGNYWWISERLVKKVYEA